MDLKTLTESLLKKDATVAVIAALIGPIEEQQEEVGYELKSTDPRFDEAFLGIDDEDGRESPRYVQLHVASGVEIKLSELVQLFGPFEVLESRRDKPPPARFMYDRPEFDFLGVVHAYVPSNPDDLAARVERLLFRREERID